MNKYVMILFCVVLAACNNLNDKDESSLFYSVAKGSRLILNKSLAIPANRATVTLQYGKVVTDKELDIYYANCKFELMSLSETSRTVYPDTFLIHKVVDERMSVSLKHKMFASLSMFANGGGSDFNYTTTMYLESMQQPDVLRIACMHWESQVDDNYLSIKQMRQAMGKIFTLQLAE